MRPAILFVHCNASGLPIPGASLDDPDYPWPTHIAAELTDEDGNNLPVPQFFSLACLSAGRTIQPGATKVHGITARDIATCGMPELSVLDALIKFSLNARRIVAYAASFDRDLVTASLRRLARERPEGRREPILKLMSAWLRPGLETVDLRDICQVVCGMDQWPSLNVAFERIVRMSPVTDEKHDAWTDVQKLKRLYFALQHRGEIGAKLIEPIMEVA